MKIRTRILLVPAVALAAAMAWGYWHASTRAYLSAKHPTLGDCSSLQGAGGGAYSACYSDYSQWSSGWATRSRTATFKVGDCVLSKVDVDSRSCSIVPPSGV